MHDRSTTATIEAYVSDINDPIHLVTFEAVQDGSIYFRALTADGAVFRPRLFDDGSCGDQSAGDHTYTNNTVRRDLPETPLGDYGIRIAAVNTSLRHITMVDAETFSIVDQATKIDESLVLPEKYILYQNYPNPFNPNTTLKYEISTQVRNEMNAFTLSGVEESLVQLKIYDILGREVTTLINEIQKPGFYEVEWNAVNLPSGVYFYRIKTGNFVKTKKMILLR